MANTKVDIEADLYDWIKSEAKKNKRTIKGQTEYLIELAMNQAKQPECITDQAQSLRDAVEARR